MAKRPKKRKRDVKVTLEIAQTALEVLKLIISILKELL